MDIGKVNELKFLKRKVEIFTSSLIKSLVNAGYPSYLKQKKLILFNRHNQIIYSVFHSNKIMC